MPIRRPKLNRDPDTDYRLSQVEIDADKDWEGRGITNIKEVSENMALGDMPVRGEYVIRDLEPGFLGYYLISRGPGRLPVWGPFSSDWVKFFSANFLLSHSESVLGIDHLANESASVSTSETHDNYYLENAQIGMSLTSSAVVPIDHSESLAANLSTVLSHSVA